MKMKRAISTLAAIATAVSCMTVTVSAEYKNGVWIDSEGNENRVLYISKDIHRSGTVWTDPNDPNAVGEEWSDEAVHSIVYTYAGDCYNDGYDVIRCETKDGAPGSSTYGQTNGVNYYWQWNGLGGHKYVDTVVAPTYEHKGYTHHECSKCGWSYDDGEVDMLKNDDDNTYTDEQGNVIERVSISPAVITLDKDYMLYSPKRTWDYEPEIVSVVLGKKTLNRGLDYTVTYKNNSGLGTGIVIITGVGAYKDTAEKEFLIAEEPPAVKGDATGDGKVNIADVIRIQQKLAGWKVKIDEKASDVTGDGKVNIADVIRIQQKLAGWKVTFK